MPYFRAMVEALDTEIGRLLEGVDLQRTTVIFLGDNGTTPQVVVPPFDPARAKNTVYEGGVHVPLFVAGAAVEVPGTTCDGLVHAVDLFATALELAGVDLAAVLPPDLALDSVSFAPYLADPALPSLRSTLFTEVFKPNGPVSGPLAEAVIGPYCQEDEGFGGPGSALLAVCGDPLIDIGSAELHLAGAPSFAPSILAVGALAQPMAILGGTMVPFPPALLVPLVADGAGELLVPGIHGVVPGPWELHLQIAVLDPDQALGLAFTNAVRVAFLPWNTKAMRDARYKLIADVYGGFTRLYDLWLDPLELVDLLAQGPLSPEAEASYGTLRAELEALLAPPD